jgi:hypothetical protein
VIHPLLLIWRRFLRSDHLWVGARVTWLLVLVMGTRHWAIARACHLCSFLSLRSIVFCKDLNHPTTGMSFLSRSFGKIQDMVTKLAYGAEKQTEKMAFYECMDKDIQGSDVKVRYWIHSFLINLIVLIDGRFQRSRRTACQRSLQVRFDQAKLPRASPAAR